ncbi:hypothetical protein GGR56DRAFT_644118 [Xylariaceae sp. FL0804]|nr:hypothetical protein GGR56DRAFT_644118 [Xylariaceae sp. FL0804]
MMEPFRTTAALSPSPPPSPQKSPWNCDYDPFPLMEHKRRVGCGLRAINVVNSTSSFHIFSCMALRCPPCCYSLLPTFPKPPAPSHPLFSLSLSLSLFISLFLAVSVSLAVIPICFYTILRRAKGFLSSASALLVSFCLSPGGYAVLEVINQERCGRQGVGAALLPAAEVGGTAAVERERRRVRASRKYHICYTLSSTESIGNEKQQQQQSQPAFLVISYSQYPSTMYSAAAGESDAPNDRLHMTRVYLADLIVWYVRSKQ